MHTLLADVRLALRRLRAHPGFTAVVLVTLALGIGANAAIFSVVDAVLLRPLPYRAPDALVAINHYYPSLQLHASVSAIGFRDYRAHARDFASVSAEASWNVNLTGIGEPRRLRGARGSAELFTTLGVAPALGRAFLPDEEEAGRNHVVVLSDGLWKQLFGARRDVIGRSIQLDGEPYEVIGVMPAGFTDFWSRDVQLWTPLVLDAKILTPANFTNEWLDVAARLRPGVTVTQAQRDMRAYAAQLRRDYPGAFPADWTLEVRPLTQLATGRIRPALLVLLGAVGFVLLIACANVANLLLARAAVRSREIAIRTALGARRRDLLRQLLTESLVLSLGGGAIGLALAYWAARALAALDASVLPRAASITLDGRVLAFTLAVAVLTGVLFGAAPAWQLTATDLQGSLREGGRGGTADRGGRRLRRALVVAEVALAITLLTGAGLLIRSFARLQGVDPGFDARHVLTFSLSLPRNSYPSDTARRAFFDAVIPRIGAVPGVRAVGATSVMPFSGGWSTGSFNVEGYTPAPNSNGPWGDIRIVSPGYFDALRIALRQGHVFTTQELEAPAAVAVVDEEFVRRFVPAGADPIGRRLWFGPPRPDSSTRFITIVGVVRHTAQEGLDAEKRVQVYVGYAQAPRVDQLTFAVRTAGDPLLAAGAVRAAIQSVDRNLPMAGVRSLESMVEQSLGQRRLSMILLGVFAGLALLLAMVGLYGVMSYLVAQRAREMGIRIALGARAPDVLRLVAQQGMTLVLAGVLVGVACALALTRLLASQLYGVGAADPATFAAVTLLLIVVALVATLVPARRATRVDPVVALREE